MRLHARDPEAIDYSVYHAEHCCMLKHVVWVDDETAQYGQWSPLVVKTIQAKRIAIIPGIHLVVINPVAEREQLELEALIGWMESAP